MKPLHLVVPLYARPGKEAALREVLLALAPPSRREAGCLQYRFLESELPGRFYADEVWESRAALDAHFETPHFRAAAARFPELVQGEVTLDFVGELGA